MKMHLKHAATNDSKQTDQDSHEYYLPAMPSARVVEILRRKVESLNKFN